MLIKKRTLPIKLNKLKPRAFRFELKSGSLKLLILPFKLYSLLIGHGKEMTRTSKCKNTIFSKYLTLPLVTFP